MGKKSGSRKSKASIKDLPLPAGTDVKGGEDLAARLAASDNRMEVMLSNILRTQGQANSSMIQNIK